MWTDTTELQLMRVYTVTLDKDGAGSISNVGPDTSWERWNIDTIHTDSDSSKDVTLEVYRANGGSPVAGSYSGNMDTDNTKLQLMPSERLRFEYSSGTAGAHCYITLHGTRVLRGKLAY